MALALTEIEFQITIICTSKPRAPPVLHVDFDNSKPGYKDLHSCMAFCSSLTQDKKIHDNMVSNVELAESLYEENTCIGQFSTICNGQCHVQLNLGLIHWTNNLYGQIPVNHELCKIAV